MNLEIVDKEKSWLTNSDQWIVDSMSQEEDTDCYCFIAVAKDGEIVDTTCWLVVTFFNCLSIPQLKIKI